jgi:GNAT superfamily N-acetyltransferase
MLVEITTWHLEMGDPAQLRAVAAPVGAVVTHAEIPSPELSRYLYTAVGGAWYWVDRLPRTYEAWDTWAKQVQTWVLYVHGTPAGYFELLREPDGDVQIAYVGLLPQFVGGGLGGYLLTRAVEVAWEMGTARVWVHTCTLDHPHALNNYRARGFVIFKERRATIEIPEVTPGPWPGAYTA